MGVWVGGLVGVEFWDADLLCTGGALSAGLSGLGEAGVRRGGGEGLWAKVKRWGGQLGVLRGGTGGKEVSEVGVTRGLG